MQTPRTGIEKTETKASPVAPRDHNSESGIYPMPIGTMQELGDGRWIDVSIVESGNIAIAHCSPGDTTYRVLSSTDAIDHARNIFLVATTALHEQSPALAEQFARAFGQELLALADSIGVAAMTPEDRKQKALDER